MDAAFPCNTPVWWLVDLRCKTDVFAHIKPFLPHIDALIGVFAESVEITHQAQWRKKIKSEKKGETPPFFLSHYLNAPFMTQLPHQAVRPGTRVPVPQLQKIRVRLPKVVLEHLLFVLCGVGQMGMRLWRVRGEVMTVEYVNPVAIEISLCGVWTYPGQGKAGVLVLEGENLSVQQLDEMFSAVVAPCEKMNIEFNPE